MTQPIQPDIGERRHLGHVGIASRKAAVCVMVFYVGAALLNGRHIHDRLQRMPFGPRRDWALRLSAPLRHLSEWTRADRLRDAVETWSHTHLDT